MVDLNGAFAGRPVNGAAVSAIVAAVGVPVQLGGGIRDMATIEMWLEKGLRRVILGTAALRDPALVKAACRRFPGRVAVGIDARARLGGGRRLGRDVLGNRRSIWRCSSRMPASPPSSIPISTATACWRAPMSRPRPPWPSG